MAKAVINTPRGDIFFREGKMIFYPTRIVWLRLQELHHRSLGKGKYRNLGKDRNYKLGFIKGYTPDYAKLKYKNSIVSILAMMAVITDKEVEKLFRSLLKFVRSTNSLEGLESPFLTGLNSVSRSRNMTLFNDGSTLLQEIGMPPTLGGNEAFSLFLDTGLNAVGLLNQDSLSELSNLLGRNESNLGVGKGNLGFMGGITPGGMAPGGRDTNIAITESGGVAIFELVGGLVGAGVGAGLGTISTGPAAPIGAGAGAIAGLGVGAWAGSTVGGIIMGVVKDDSAPTPEDGGDDAPTPVDEGDDGTTPVDGGDDGTTPVDGGDDGTTPVDGGDDGTTPEDGGDDGTTPEDGGDDGTTPVDGGDEEMTDPDAETGGTTRYGGKVVITNSCPFGNGILSYLTRTPNGIIVMNGLPRVSFSEGVLNAGFMGAHPGFNSDPSGDDSTDIGGDFRNGLGGIIRPVDPTNPANPRGRGN